MPSQSVDTDIQFSFDQPQGWRAPSHAERQKFEKGYVDEVGDVGVGTTLEALHPGDPPAIMNVTAEAAPPGLDTEEALVLVGGFPGQSKLRPTELDGDDALVVSARLAGQNDLTRIVAVSVHDGLIVSLIFSTLDDSPIEPLEDDADEIFGSWRWAPEVG